MSSAYDWFLKVEVARAEGSARREREESDRVGMLRRAGLAQAKSGATQGRGVNTQTRKSVMGFSGMTRGGEMLRPRVPVEEHRSGSSPKAKLAGRGIGSSASNAQTSKPSFAPPVTGNGKLASGHQPVVIKVVSYAGGARRAGATAKYVQRGDVVLETHDSKLLDNHDAVEAEINAWAEQFDTRKPSQDVVTFGIFVSGLVDSAEGRAEIKAGIEAAFAGHAHAWRYEVHEGQLSARAVVVMSGLQERFGIVEQGGARRLSAQSERVISGRLAEAEANKARVETMSAPGHGREGASYQLRKLAAGGALQHANGEIRSVQDAKDLARVWAPQLRSRGPRDTMHVVFSAKSTSTEEHEAFRMAVRLFLHETFPDHKFMFGLHADKQGRIHAHAVVAVRGDNGEKLRPNRLTFLAWRESFAEKAQEQGIKLVATVARQQASSQSYGKFDKAIVAAADNPRPGREAADMAYNRRFPHVAAAARHRISLAKVNPPTWAVTEKQRAVAGASLASWQDIAKSQPSNMIAKEQVQRLNLSLNGGRYIGTLLDLSQKETDLTSIQMAASLVRMNDMVDKVAEGLSDQAREAFRARTSKILTDFGTRIDLKRLQEQGVHSLGGEELRRVAQFSGDRLIARAREIEAKERQEAIAAGRKANQAIDQERKDRAIDPTSIQQSEQDRQVTEEALRNATQQGREAKAAASAARDLEVNPGRQIDAEALMTSPHLRDLKAEQERAIRNIKSESDKEGPERTKPTRQR